MFKNFNPNNPFKIIQISSGTENAYVKYIRKIKPDDFNEIPHRNLTGYDEYICKEERVVLRFHKDPSNTERYLIAELIFPIAIGYNLYFKHRSYKLLDPIAKKFKAYFREQKSLEL